MKLNYSASGKLLLFGEYFVLRGTKSYSFPLKFGQSLTVTPREDDAIYWECLDENNHCWLSIQFANDFSITATNDASKATIVQQLVHFIQQNNPTFKAIGHTLQFTLNFNRQYGFGTSSTMLSLLSQWSGVDAYLLLEHSFKGSGYDLAVATATQPIVYTIKDKIVETCSLPETISNHLLFVYLGAKQSSAHEIANFREKHTSDAQLYEMDAIVEAAKNCVSIENWELLMTKSEQLLSSVLETSPIKNRLFSDYPHAIKSLGAWGGDFIMAATNDMESAKAYFSSKGYPVQFSYDELV
ncbi:MAG: GYDIA family GHMP kinase [Crocinitomicaceae bacterium]|nr:GYDIA family GHMP kinase [Crocinitomicaceae bacterium]